MSRILVTGVPGVGKTTIAKLASSRLGWAYLSFGDHMFAAARSAGAVRIRDDLRQLPESVRARLEGEAAAAFARQQDALVDTQLVIRKTDGLRIMPTSLARLLAPSGIVLLEAHRDTVLERRRLAADSDRARPGDENLQADQKLTKERAIALALELGVPVHTLESHGTPEETAAALVKIVRALSGLGGP